MKYLYILLLSFLHYSLSATAYIVGIIQNDFRKCDNIESIGTTIIQQGSNVEIVSNKSVLLKPGFKASSSNNTRLRIYTDQEDCCPCNGTLIDDRDNQSYNTIRINDQVWMEENFDYDAPGSWQLNENGIDFGRQYHYYAYMNGSTNEGAKGICPSGWHIPTAEEIRVLGEPYDNTNEFYHALKENGSTGFDALIHNYAWAIPSSTGPLYWSEFMSTLFGSSTMHTEDTQIGLLVEYKDYQTGNITEEAMLVSTPMIVYQSVRCIKDCSRSVRELTEKSSQEEIEISIINDLSDIQRDGFSAKVYPNPSTEYCMVELLNTRGSSYIKIYDLDGQLIQELNTDGSVVKINLSEYKKGVYVISVINGLYCTNKKLIID